MAIKYSYGRQSISEEDISAVIDTLRSDWLTQGPKVQQFERTLAKKFGAKHAVAVANGTAALHVSALALGWQPGDIVITSPITFLASANCILYAGATPDFVDIDPKTYTIDTNQLARKLQDYQNRGRSVKAVVGVDYAGQPCDWPGLRELADQYGLQLVCDACHALGAEIENDQGYAAKYADLVVLSFHPVKHITTGEGGAVLTNDSKLSATLRMLSSHGMTKDGKMLEKNDGPWYYEMQSLGFNYRITDFQCALGLSQLGRLDDFVGRRRAIADFYDGQFQNLDGLTTPYVAPGVRHAYHLYPLVVDFRAAKLEKAALFSALAERRISLQVHYIPVHLQPYYRHNYGFRKGNFPVAEKFYEAEVSIPMYPDLTEFDLTYISKQIRSCLYGE